MLKNEKENGFLYEKLIFSYKKPFGVSHKQGDKCAVTFLRYDLTPMSHISVLLLRPLKAYWQIAQLGVYIDATFGRGGHTRLLLSKLDENARVYAFDKDPQALEVAAAFSTRRSKIYDYSCKFC
ncbi:16S rRNA (cytosine(1402)-N(4))-methyltransferase [Acinetobacter baumannii]